VVAVFVTAFPAGSVLEGSKAVGVRAILPKAVDFDKRLPPVEESNGTAARAPAGAL
jgi:hypothetical protein